MNRDKIERLFWQQVEQGKDTEEKIAQGILDSMDNYPVRHEIAFSDHVESVVSQIMDSDAWEDHLREMAEIEYEERHPYKVRGVARDMF